MLLLGEPPPGTPRSSDRIVMHPALASLEPRMHRINFLPRLLYCGIAAAGADPDRRPPGPRPARGPAADGGRLNQLPFFPAFAGMNGVGGYWASAAADFAEVAASEAPGSLASCLSPTGAVLATVR